MAPMDRGISLQRPDSPAAVLEFGGHHPANRRDAEPILNEKPRLVEITGRGFLKKGGAELAAALRDTNTASCYENMTGKLH